MKHSPTRRSQGGFLGSLFSAGASLIGGILGNKSQERQADEANQQSEISTAKQMEFQNEQNRLAESFSADQYGIARSFNKEEAEINRAFQKTMTGKNRRFQERMSATAVRRQMKDLRAGGLNPILAARYGGSSTPGGNVPSGSQATAGGSASGVTSSGSSYSGQQAKVTNVLSPAVQAYWSAKSNAASIDNTEANTKLTEAATSKTESETKNTMQSTINKVQELSNLVATEENLSQDKKIKIKAQLLQAAQLALTKAKTRTERELLKQLETHITRLQIDRDYHKNVGKIDRYARGITEKLKLGPIRWAPTKGPR